MSDYQGTAPCHGCGKTGEEKPRAKRSGLCRDCSAAIRKYNAYRTYIENAEKPSEWVHVLYAGPYTQQIGPNCGATLLRKYRSGLADALDVFFRTYLDQNGVPFLEATEHQIVEELSFGQTTFGVHHDVVIPKRDMEAIFKMAKILEDGWEEAVGDVQSKVDQAFRDGQNLLLSLNRSPSFGDQANAKSVER